MFSGPCVVRGGVLAREMTYMCCVAGRQALSMDFHRDFQRVSELWGVGRDVLVRGEAGVRVRGNQGENLELGQSGSIG